ncbi:MAG: 1-acyl-sn-glycerol-3-phosphate acyltransferase [Alphaproteobacteria bacterium]|nr:1-acyl-sn-glycerol-3-phosphate acyltransferase [Alphaproteobacteria bacterium]
MGVLVLPLLLGPARLILAYSRVWIRGALWLLRITVGLTYEVRGSEHIAESPVLYAVKHQSAWDTLAINLLVRDGAIVLKRELTWIPVFGWCLLKARQIPIDRDGGPSALRRMVAAAQARLRENRPLIIYPEGTRVAPGAAAAYHAGAAALYGALDVPVVPVALNSGLFWPRRSLNLRPGKITIEFLPALGPGLPRREFLDKLETAIESATEKLIEDAVSRYDLHRSVADCG